MCDNDIFLSMSAATEVATSPLRELRVLSGLHQGAALTLPNDTATVGSDTNCTVVLLDEGVRPVHLTLRWIDGIGWTQPEEPGLAITKVLRVGPVWLSIVTPHTPWVTLDQLLSESTSTATLNPMDVATVCQTPAKFPRRSSVRLALLALLVSSVCLLMFVLSKYQTQTISTSVAVTEASAVIDVPYTPLHKSAISAATVRPPDSPSEDVLAVVNGKTGFALMRNGQRVYIGESVGGFVLLEIQGSTAIWRSRSAPIDSE